MGLDALLDAVERRGLEEAAAVLRRAESEAEAIEREAETRGRERRERSLGELETRLRAESGAALATARHTARARVLKARQGLLERAFGSAGRALPEAALSARYRGALPALVSAALACVEPEGAVVECAPGLAEETRRVVGDLERGQDPGRSGGARVAVRVSPEASTGVRVLDGSGRVVVDSTLATRLDRRRPRLAIAALAAFTALADAGPGAGEPG